MRRRRRNQIMGIQKNNSWITDPDSIKEIFFDHFSSFFNSEGKEPVFQLGTLPIPSLSVPQSKGLECHFTIEEIEAALNEMNPHKAPGPDGLNVRFLKTHWTLLKMDIKRFFDEFFDDHSFPKGISSSFVSLIPKVKIPKEVKDFRPISLINCSLKLLTKALTNRMRSVLNSIISQSQSAYVPGRQISDSIFITNVVVHGLNVGLMHGLIIKLDFEKAVDSISQDFLIQCMKRMNFGAKWIQWILSIFERFKNFDPYQWIPN